MFLFLNFSLIVIPFLIFWLLSYLLKILKTFAAKKNFIHICLNNEFKQIIYYLVVANV